MAKKMRFAIVGTGGRSRMYWNALVNDGEIAGHNELVALLDPNITRMKYVLDELDAELPTYQPQHFREMVKKEKLDGIIVTTRDSLHDRYIVGGLEAGLKVITEKPMTTDEHKCQRILDAVKGREKNLVVTFNYRYAPHNSKAKELLQSGIIGEITMVEFQWFLDVTHGADYYRRWHRQKVNSGSLWVHKATHHFDLVNWWTGAVPELVYALGAKRFYRPETFPARERCHTCDVQKECSFFLDMAGKKGGRLKRMYLDAEHEDGYFRDRCVFSPDIDVWDTRAATVRYTNGMLMSYSLNNYAPFEGYRVGFVGTKGRMDLFVHEHAYINSGGEITLEGATKNMMLRVYPLFEKAYDVEIEKGKGGHGGGDSRLLHDCFLPRRKKDPLGRAAGSLDGAHSILVGVAARRSIEWRRPVRIDELVNF
jgi:predicted dehydrogenase